jgi:hypothetical protein
LQCYDITHLRGDAVASTKLGLRAPPLRNCWHRLNNWRYWLAFFLKPSVYGVGGGDDVGEGAGLRAGRGSGGKNVIFSNGPNSTFECFNLLK